MGIIGHTLTDATYGAPWWSWVLADGVFGLLLGLSKRFLDLQGGDLTAKKLIQFNV